MTGIDKLRAMVRFYDNGNEDFAQHFTIPQLEALYDAYKASDWGFHPDKWTGRQLDEALLGKAPQWDEKERPVY